MADMVKRKLEDFTLQEHFDNFLDVDMSIAEKSYNDVVDRIQRIRDFFQNKMNLLYTSFVRKDPYRSFYNY